jgi:hypothetical protein
MTAKELIQEVLREMEEALATDFMSDATRDIYTRSIASLKQALMQLNG